MNKLIGQLAEQAGLLGPGSRVGDSHEATERFANLIIEECVRESDKQTIYCRGIPWGKWVKDHFEIL